MNEEELGQFIKQQLDQGIRQLDPAVGRRLQEARRVALARALQHQHSVSMTMAGHPASPAWTNGPTPQGRRVLWGLMLLLTLLLTLYWWQNTTQDSDDDTGQLDAKMLSGEIPPQDFARKDFGAWLDETH